MADPRPVRVGIMSMQRIHNYGSSLQAYGLRRLIEQACPTAEVDFLDYRPGPVLVGEAPSSGRLARTVSKVLEYNKVDTALRHKLRFFDHKRRYGARYFPMLGIPATVDHRTDVDVEIIGSDEVFNCVQSNTNVGYSGDLFGRGSNAGSIVSYAGSFGNTTLAKIEAVGIRRALERDFSHFDAISVRDRNSAEIITALTGRQPQLHVDPVLAHDFSAEPRIPSGRPVEDPYLIVYGYSGRLSSAENARLAEYAGARGARILCFGGVQECCDEFVECDPFELLAYFRDAVGVITDTFHGTIFSLINHTPFGTIVRPSQGHGYGNEEKLGYLLESFGVTSQRITELTDVAAVLDRDVDFDAVDATLARERESSRAYLASVVAGKGA